MKIYHHAYSVQFTVSNSHHPDGKDITAEKFEAALAERMKEITELKRWDVEVQLFDTFEVEAPLIDFTVIGFREATGQIWCGHVKAACKAEAFAAAAAEEECMTFVACIEGLFHEADILGFPGEGIVGAETVLSQPEVFGCSDVSNQHIGEW